MLALGEVSCNHSVYRLSTDRGMIDRVGTGAPHRDDPAMVARTRGGILAFQCCRALARARGDADALAWEGRALTGCQGFRRACTPGLDIPFKRRASEQPVSPLGVAMC